MITGISNILNFLVFLRLLMIYVITMIQLEYDRMHTKPTKNIFCTSIEHYKSLCIK